MKTLIAIPSYNRAQFFKKTRFCTANWISPEYWKQTTYYVEDHQVGDYLTVMRGTGGKIRNASNAPIQGQWSSIMDYIVDTLCNECDHLVIMDDDLALARRPNLPLEPTRFEELTPSMFNSMIDALRFCTTEKRPLTSVQYRQFCQGKTANFQFNQRISMIWSLNAKFFRNNPDFRFYRGSGLTFMADYHFFMNLLVHGYENLCINGYTKDDRPNAPGGIQANARKQLFNDNVKRFAAMYPAYVTTRVKEGKGNWEDGMLGVTIRAAKAFKAAGAAKA